MVRPDTEGSATLGTRLVVPAVKIEPDVLACVQERLAHVARELLSCMPLRLVAAVKFYVVYLPL